MTDAIVGIKPNVWESMLKMFLPLNSSVLLVKPPTSYSKKAEKDNNVIRAGVREEEKMWHRTRNREIL